MTHWKFTNYSKLFLIILIVGVFLFPTSVFYGNHNKIFENSNANNTFKVIIYKAKVYNLFSLYKFLRGENYFFVVYNKCGKVVFKPHLWFGMDRSVVYGGFHFSNHDKNTLFFPSNDGVDSIDLGSAKYECS
ncbi:hypothetical protein [Citrobacter meridianamericanus]|uniref:hypothetical protein n=1 Tax=Citrobacter meridianamericanus TaxID=2894201 RepID=UPI00351D11E5